jgi:hypothetical protein
MPDLRAGGVVIGRRQCANLQKDASYIDRADCR